MLGIANKFEYIGFDADDTLWVNEPYYRDTEQELCVLLSDEIDEERVRKTLFETEVKNIGLFGYGAKSFTLSMIETALMLTEQQIDPSKIAAIIALGKALIERPIVLLDGVEGVLKELHASGQKMIVATKGDLLDQRRKLDKSGLAGYFHHIETMTEKKEDDYRKLFLHLGLEAESFLMIGNSLKSDIVPVLNLGGAAIHVPYHTTWEYENGAVVSKTDRFAEVKEIGEILKLLV